MHLFKTSAAIATALALTSCSAPLQSPIVSSAGDSSARSTAVKGAGGIAQWEALPSGLRRPLGLSSRSVNRDSYFNCPPKGELIYQSDAAQNVINIYLSDLAVCGLLNGFNEPEGIAINNHNLYVADTGNHRIEAFHRGAPEPYLTFTDPFGQIPVDVAVSPDGTVIASNLSTEGSVTGSISTFKSNGRFIEAYLLKDEFQGSYITTFSNGVTYVDGTDMNGAGALWQVSCPGGFCGVSTELGTPFTIPGGLDESNSQKLVANDQIANTGDTFSVPGVHPVTFTENGGDNEGMALTSSNAKWYSADAINNEVVCYQYAQNGKSAGTCGSVKGTPGGVAVGIAIDPGSI